MKKLFILTITSFISGEIYEDVLKTSYTDLESANAAGLAIVYNMARKINNSKKIKGIAYVKKTFNSIAELHYNNSTISINYKEVMVENEKENQNS